jgi:hypothetical protein
LVSLSLADYDINAPSGFEASGVVWHSRLDKLFANDDGGRVLRMDRDGTNQTLWDVPGDLEGICVPDPATDLIYVGIEYDGGHLTPAIQEFNFTSGTVTRTFYLNLPGATASQGLEALTFVPNASHPQGGEFYVGHQGNGDIYTYDLPILTGGGSGNTYNYNHTIVTNRTDLAGLHYNATGRVLDALFDSFNKIQVIRLNGSVIHEFDLAPKAGFSEDEGIGEDNMGHLYIARENGAEGMISVLKNFLDITGPKVTSVVLSDPSPTRAGDVTFTIGFDEPVDMNSAPKVAIGKAFPFTAHPLTSLGWVNSTYWRGHLVIDGSTGDGWNNISVSGARDVIGNLMEPDWNHTFLVDTRAPGARSVDLSPKSPVGNGTVTFTIEFDEPMDSSFDPSVRYGDVAPYDSYKVDPIGWTNGTVWVGEGGIFWYTPDGLNHIRIMDAVDLGNNTMLDDWNNTFVIDNTGPSVLSVTLSDPSPVKAGAVNITVEFDEAMDTSVLPLASFGLAAQFDKNAISSTGWSNGTTWAGTFVVDNKTGDGLNRLRIMNARDVLANVMSPDTSVTFEVDTKCPVVASVRMDPPSPLVQGQVNFTIEFSEPMDTTNAPIVAFGLDPPYADHALTAKGWSDAMNWTGTYAIDNSTGDGPARLSVTGAQDVAGNPMFDYNGSVFVIDTTPPESNVQELPPYHNVHQILLDSSAEDAGTGIARVEYFYRFNGSGDYTMTPQLFVAARDGQYEFYSIATDNVGNKEKPPRAPDAITIVDMTPPVVTRVTFDRPGPYSSSVKVTVIFSEAVNTSLLKVTFGTISPFDDHVVLGAPVAPETWTGEIVVKNNAPKNGTYTLSIAGAKDLAGNGLIPNRTTRVVVQWPSPPADTSPPTVTTLSLDKGTPVGKGAVNVTIIFSETMDLAGPLTVNLGSGNGPEHQVSGAWVDNRTWTGSVAVADTWADGTYMFSIRGGKDRAGNAMLEDTAHTMDVRIDKPRPHNGWGLAQWSIITIVAIVACVVTGLLLLVYGRRKKGKTTVKGPSDDTAQNEDIESQSKGP